MPPKNPANPAPGRRERLPGYPEDKNPAGTPDPNPEEFPGKPPSVYAGRTAGRSKNPDRPRDNPDVNQLPAAGDRGRKTDTGQRPRQDDRPDPKTQA